MTTKGIYKMLTHDARHSKWQKKNGKAKITSVKVLIELIKDTNKKESNP